ncbi:hypothetical protein ACJMK2_037352 [Sinanodonta woodiana]|uniref:Disheveled-associated activator of morphogenesis 1 n=1 Tax=Sinanodonta woodiana TaxID=1069815 RepID=A0ABD3WLE3_SINWO
MPSKQTFCWCFGGRPPEIRYGIDVASPLKSMALEIPMPSDENELNTKFEELVAELDLDKPHRDALFNLPPEKKWQIYCSKTQIVSYNEEDIETREKLVENLKTALRTQPMSFVVRFMQEDGLQVLLNFLSGMDFKVAQSNIHTAIIGCVKALMNNTQGRAHVLAHPNSINIIAQSLSCENLKTKVAVLEILGAVCLVPGGHRKALEAMLHFQKYAAERTRFQSLIFDMDRSTGVYREDVSLKTAIISFINALVGCGPGKDHLEFRLHLRYEFLMLGIQPVIDKLRKHDNETLNRHLDFFEMMRNEDEKVLAKKFEGVHIDTKSASVMFEILKKKLTMSASHSHLLSLLYHLLLLPYGNSSHVMGAWQLIDRIVQQVVLQLKTGHDTDAAPLELSVKNVIMRLTNEEDIKGYQQKLREHEKATEELNLKLAKKERECEAKSQEKDELVTTVSRMKAKLEKELAGYAETKQQLADTNTRLEEIQIQLEMERKEHLKLQYLIKTGSLPDDAKLGVSNVSSLINIPPTNLQTSNPRVAVPAPPPPPPIPNAPPPPPPLSGGLPVNGNHPGIAVRNKKVPQPSQPLKSLNWTKLSEGTLSGTVWSEIDESKIYHLLDLEEFEKTFSAYQKKQIDGDNEDSKSTKMKTKELSVIDGRRAQNCTILLSKLKLSNEEIARAMLVMDEQEDIPKDMLEQLLKFVPSNEEIQLLSELGHDIDQMARADRFLYEMGKITHYEERVTALYFKKKFQDRMLDIKPKIGAVFEGSKQMCRSRQLKKLLEIVLAYGNYMNRGQRGNARGFTLRSLNNLVDTKSSISKNVTLLHYLVEVLEKKFPDLLKLENEVEDVKMAAKVNFTELNRDLTLLQTGLKDIEKELEYFKDKQVTPGDRFVTVMTEFATVASYNFSEVEESFAEMKQKFEFTLKAFGEDPSKTQHPDEFFGPFVTFLLSMKDAVQDNEKQRRQKEEEEKRVRLEEQLRAEREKQRLKRGASSFTGADHSEKVANGDPKGEFDDLISALRTGDVFGDDMAKMKRNRKRLVGKVETSSRERLGPSIIT